MSEGVQKYIELPQMLLDDVRRYVEAHYVPMEARSDEAPMPPKPAKRPGTGGKKLFHKMSFSAQKKESAPDEKVLGSAADTCESVMEAPSVYAGNANAMPLPQYSLPKQSSLEEALKHMSDSFQERLMRLIDERGKTDAEVYKRAGLDRKLFSKIRCNPQYVPRKSTALALAVALELSLDETIDLLKRAGLALSPSSKSDLILTYCLENRILDPFTINALLDEYGQPVLGA
ncbi:MAG: hypothetical protein K5981_01230 [Clostridia bacterium]|nr:hypothetical protein [Clostridia bacterium]